MGKIFRLLLLRVLDNKGIIVPEAANKITFEVSGPGEIVATDNGDPADLVSFSSKERNAFNGLALVIIRSKAKQPGLIKVTAKSDGLPVAQLTIEAR